MKYKISLLFFLLFFIAYVDALISELGQGEAGGRLREALRHDGHQLYSRLFRAGRDHLHLRELLRDARRGIARWRSEKKREGEERGQRALREGQAPRDEGRAREGGGVLQPRHSGSVPDMEEAYLAFSDMYAARGEPAKAGDILDLARGAPRQDGADHC